MADRAQGRSNDGMTLGQLRDRIDAVIESLGTSAPIRVHDWNTAPVNATSYLSSIDVLDREFYLTTKQPDDA